MTRKQLIIWIGAAFAACVLAGGLLRHFSNPQTFPLPGSGVPNRAWAATFNPGVAAFRTWIHWGALEVGDVAPILRASRDRAEHPERPMYRPRSLASRGVEFVYTPVAALAVRPLVGEGSSLETATDTISRLNHVLALVGAGLLGAIALRGRGRRPGDMLFVAALTLAGYPLAKSLELTQAGVWIFFFIALAVFLFDHKRFLTAGIAFALGVSIKPHLVLALLIVAALPRFPRRFVLACFATILVTAALNLGYAGFENCRAYLFDLLPALSAGYAYAPNQSINGVLLRAFSDHDPVTFELAENIRWIRWTSTAAGIGIVLATLVALRRRLGDPGSESSHLIALGAAICASVLASPVCWIHHYVLFLPALCIAARCIRERGAPLSVRVAIVVGGVVASFFFDAHALGNGLPALLSGPELYGGLAVWWGIVRLAGQPASAT